MPAGWVDLRLSMSWSSSSIFPAVVTLQVGGQKQTIAGTFVLTKPEVGVPWSVHFGIRSADAPACTLTFDDVVVE
jgi:hypothetical protein